jgi:hypothetical protein
LRFIEGLTKRTLPPTRDMVKNFASEIAKEPVSEAWVTRFINRHEARLVSHWITGIDHHRHEADSEINYKA